MIYRELKGFLWMCMMCYKDFVGVLWDLIGICGDLWECMEIVEKFFNSTKVGGITLCQE